MNNNKHACYLCNKFYCSNSSLKSHINNYHDNINLIYKCKFCDEKEYTIYSSFKKHEKKCKDKKEKEQNLELLKQQKYYEIEILKIKRETLEIKKQNLKQYSKKILQPNNINNSILNISNNITNNYICNFVAREDINSPNHIKNLLSRKEQIEFAKETHSSNFVTSIVQKVFCDNLKNVYLTNLNGKFIYIYKDNRFIVAKGNDVIDNIVKGKMCEIIEMIDSLLDEKKNKCPRIQDVIMKKLHIKKNDFFEERKNENFTKKNKDRIIIMLYNNQENIKDAYTLITDEALNEEQLEQIVKDNII